MTHVFALLVLIIIIMTIIEWLFHNLVEASFDLFRYLLLGDQLISVAKASIVLKLCPLLSVSVQMYLCTLLYTAVSVHMWSLFAVSLQKLDHTLVLTHGILMQLHEVGGVRNIRYRDLMSNIVGRWTYYPVRPDSYDALHTLLEHIYIPSLLYIHVRLAFPLEHITKLTCVSQKI